jgi:hypothetical protein
VNDQVARRRRSTDRYSQYQSLPIVQAATNTQNESVDDLPLPPTPTTTNHPQENHYRYESIPNQDRNARTSSASMSSSSSATKRSQSQPPKSLTSLLNGNHASSPSHLTNGTGTVIPAPQIDRHKKPGSARIVRDGYHTYSVHRSPAQVNGDNSSLDRRGHIRDMKMTVYDGTGYGTTVVTPNGHGSTSPDTVGSRPVVSNNGLYTTARYHRSQSQEPGYKAIYSNGYGRPEKTTSGGRPVVQPSSVTNVYKPVPPPKPTSYPSHSMSIYGNTSAAGKQGTVTSFTAAAAVEGNYMNSNPPPPNSFNGLAAKNEDDSGQGSSLDRDYGLYNNEPRYVSFCNFFIYRLHLSIFIDTRRMLRNASRFHEKKKKKS